MSMIAKRWAVKDKSRLIPALLQALAGDAHISFEGTLIGSKLMSVQGASVEETKALKRGTLWPKQDFIVIPLEEETIARFFQHLGAPCPRRFFTYK